MSIHFPPWRNPHTPADTDAYKTLIRETYQAAKRDTLAAEPDTSEHRRRFMALAAQTADRIPLPMGIVPESERSALAAETIDVAPHDFELARLIQELDWITRTVLSERGGSAVKMPERLASRGMTGVHVVTIRALENKSDNYLDWSGVGTAAAMLGVGNCGESTMTLAGLAQAMDEATLEALDIDLDLSKLRIAAVRDWPCGHAYVVIHHAANGVLDFSMAPTFRNAWAADGHQLYPMACRYDRSTYNHYPHVTILPAYAPAQRAGETSARRPGLDLGVAAQIGQRMAEALGPRWADRGFTNPTLMDRLRNPMIEMIMRRQGVGDYTQIDLTGLGPKDRAKLERRLAKLEHRILLRVFEEQLAKGKFKEEWVGRYTATNPNLVYRNAATGALLAPSVPVHYLRSTERRRWAWEVYQDPPEPAWAWTRLQASRQSIPPAVQAIEQEPFLGALAAARVMDFSANALHPGRTADFDRALTVLEDWIGRMQHNVSRSAYQRIWATGLKPQVMQALECVQRNLVGLAQVATALEGLSEDSQQRAEAVALRERAQNSPAQRQIADIRLSLSRPLSWIRI